MLGARLAGGESRREGLRTSLSESLHASLGKSFSESLPTSLGESLPTKLSERVSVRVFIRITESQWPNRGIRERVAHPGSCEVRLV